MADDDVVTGFDALDRTLSGMGSAGLQALAAALYQRGEAIMADSKEQFVPVDTGALRGSGYVTQPVINASEAAVELGYGGPSIDYAVVVHENPEAHHPIGQWKYLEAPLLAALADLPEQLGADVLVAFERAR